MTQQTERHPLPPIVCAPWCVDGGGQPDTLFRADQTCWGPDLYMDLSLEEVTLDSQGVWPQRLGMVAYRRGGCTSCASSTWTISNCRAIATHLIRRWS